MLRILGIMTAVVGPRPLAVVAMDVLHPGRPFLEREHDVGRLERRLGKAGRDAIEVADHAAMILHEHRRDWIELRGKIEQRERAEWLPPPRYVHLMPIDVAHRVHEGRLL